MNKFMTENLKRRH